ncbi:MAG: LPS-assembly protein LptD [Aquabacterium sp.]
MRLPPLDWPKPFPRSLRRVAAAAIGLAGCAAALAQSVAPTALPSDPAPAALPLRLEPKLRPLPRGEALRRLPLFLRADQLRVRPDLDAVAEGHVEFRRGGSVIRSDRLDYDHALDRAHARGGVRIERDGNRYQGSELQLEVQRFEGFLLEPQYEFARTGAGGRAERIDFLDSARSMARGATYSSCPRDGGQQPDWQLVTQRVRLDFDANEGIAEGAVLRFLGVPILALPVLSFPLTDERRSGWLPPRLGIDSKSGVELAVPWYWNIAPQRDATLTPTVRTRRGFGIEGEFRYLSPRWRGEVALDWLPDDRVAGRSRLAGRLDHEGDGPVGSWYRLQWRHVSDNDHWKDFPGALQMLTPRLLPADARAERTLATPWGPALAYARVQRWQVLQSADAAITVPYQRSPQLGLLWSGAPAAGWQARLQSEVNRFTLADPADVRPQGWRAHVLADLRRPFGGSAWWVTPRLDLNAAAYAVDRPNTEGQRRMSRVLPSVGLEAGLVLERRTRWFGQAMQQTLEPRLQYVNTPFRAQARLPNFDAANRDFNLLSVFADADFSGIDRVADAHRLTLGATTRLTDATTGAEVLRLSVAQRVPLRDQQVTLTADGQDGPASKRQVSDLLVEGRSTVWPGWTVEGAMQYDPDQARLTRSILAARWHPAPFQTVGATYRLARGLSEQMELGWQWPLYRGRAQPVGAAGGCGGTLYGVGRINYSLRDSRITDSIVGLEYDSGCWIARVVAERLSTGRSDATTRLMLQLELVGLSRLGSNPLQTLKDNIPGYRLLREPRGAADSSTISP